VLAQRETLGASMKGDELLVRFGRPARPGRGGPVAEAGGRAVPKRGAATFHK